MCSLLSIKAGMHMCCWLLNYYMFLLWIIYVIVTVYERTRTYFVYLLIILVGLVDELHYNLLITISCSEFLTIGRDQLLSSFVQISCHAGHRKGTVGSLVPTLSYKDIDYRIVLLQYYLLVLCSCKLSGVKFVYIKSVWDFLKHL